jgi:hypothetical protein
MLNFVTFGLHLFRARGGAVRATREVSSRALGFRSTKAGIASQRAEIRPVP